MWNEANSWSLFGVADDGDSLQFNARTKDLSSFLFTEEDAVGLLQRTKSINSYLDV